MDSTELRRLQMGTLLDMPHEPIWSGLRTLTDTGEHVYLTSQRGYHELLERYNRLLMEDSPVTAENRAAARIISGLAMQPGIDHVEIIVLPFVVDTWDEWIELRGRVFEVKFAVPKLIVTEEQLKKLKERKTTC